MKQPSVPEIPEVKSKIVWVRNERINVDPRAVKPIQKRVGRMRIADELQEESLISLTLRGQIAHLEKEMQAASP